LGLKRECGMRVGGKDNPMDLCMHEEKEKIKTGKRITGSMKNRWCDGEERLEWKRCARSMSVK
jgi:hypothetical protein